jgi:hypothetical protein
MDVPKPNVSSAITATTRDMSETKVPTVNMKADSLYAIVRNLNVPVRNLNVPNHSKIAATAEAIKMIGLFLIRQQDLSL